MDLQLAATPATYHKVSHSWSLRKTKEQLLVFHRSFQTLASDVLQARGDVCCDQISAKNDAKGQRSLLKRRLLD